MAAKALPALLLLGGGRCTLDNQFGHILYVFNRLYYTVWKGMETAVHYVLAGERREGKTSELPVTQTGEGEQM